MLNNKITKVHSFSKQCLHKDLLFNKDLIFINWHLISALVSLERFGEEDPHCFHKLKIVQTLFTKQMDFISIHLLVICISLLWQRGTRPEKRRDYYIKKKKKSPSSILHWSNCNLLLWLVRIKGCQVMQFHMTCSDVSFFIQFNDIA
jgi:hypothetical protein